MNLLKRLKNLWSLSEYKPSADDKTIEVGDVISAITKKVQPKMGEIIKRKPIDPIDEIIQKEKTDADFLQ